METAHETHAADDREPTAISGGRYELFGSHDQEDLVGWLALVFPHDTEHFLAGAIHAVLRAAAFTEVSHDAVRVLRALADHPGRVGNLATTCPAAGLSASRLDQRAAAVDAVLELGRTSRLGAEQLAAGLTSFVEPATFTRLATTFRDVATESRATRNLVIDALAMTLPAVDHGTKGVHALLELLREELVREGRPTPANLRPWLDRFGGGSRASKAAGALLETMWGDTTAP